jgi:hypothetical protein
MKKHPHKNSRFSVAERIAAEAVQELKSSGAAPSNSRSRHHRCGF